MNHDDIDEVVAKMRHLGITKYTRGDFHLELGPEPIKERPPLSEKDAMLMREEQAKFKARYVHDTLFRSSSAKPVFRWSSK